MPDDVSPPDEDQDDLAPVAHDDIMKRLLDYQRRFREENPSEPSHPLVDYSAMEAQAALATATEEIVDLTEIEESEDEIEESAAEIEVIEVVEVVEVDEADVPPEAAKSAQAEAMHERDAEDTAPMSAETPASKAAEPVVTKAEESPPAAEGNLAERVEQLEASLDEIAMMLAAVRSDFQDLAIRADERIAEIEDALASARGSSS